MPPYGNKSCQDSCRARITSTQSTAQQSSQRKPQQDLDCLKRVCIESELPFNVADIMSVGHIGMTIIHKVHA